MELIELLEKSQQRDLSDYGALADMFEILRLLEKDEFFLAHEKNKDVRRLSAKYALENKDAQMFDLNQRALLFDAPHDFDAYLQYLEADRRPEERFYLPRRRIMKQLVYSMQSLADGELDELFLSMPPRVGKTSVLMFFVTWLLGRDSERSNLYSAYSDTITTAFYNGCLEIMTDPVTYKWSEIFPSSKIVSTSAKDETINVDRKKRYPSLTCRSLYGTLNGACDCNGMLISDDLIGGIEEAMNKDRLMSAWAKVDNNLIPRAKENAKVLWCGTRWSIVDPAGVRMDLLLNDERYKDRNYKIINLPALDDEEHSNFHYLYDVGFSEDYYYQRRASFERNNDMASWMAQYMGEPVERSGALFEPEDMRFYNGNLPEWNPVRIFMAVDSAYGGGDYTSAPVCYQYENGDIYVPDVVFNDGDKRVTQPLIVKKIKQHGVNAVRFEANKSTSGYKDDIEARLKQDGYKLNIEARPAPTHTAKDMRIKDRAPEIRDFFFLEEGKRHKEYSAFMTNLYSYKLIGKNKHDDAPDSLAQAVDMIINPNRVVSIFKRGY